MAALIQERGFRGFANSIPTFLETVPATISPSQRPTSAVVSSSSLTNQNLIGAKLVSIRDKLVKDKNRGEIYCSTSMSHKNPFTTRNSLTFCQTRRKARGI